MHIFPQLRKLAGLEIGEVTTLEVTGVYWRSLDSLQDLESCEDTPTGVVFLLLSTTGISLLCHGYPSYCGFIEGKAIT